MLCCPLLGQELMEIDCLVLGEFETNCYVVRSSESAADCLIIDPGLGAADLLAFLERERLEPRAVVLTHGHIDHIAAVESLRRRFANIKVYVHKLDAPLLSDTGGNLSFMTGRPFSASDADFLLGQGDEVNEAQMSFTVLHTPGHTPGGMCLYAESENIIFVGDTLFADSVGRTDFPGGDMSQLIESITEKLLVLPDETKVYAGHGPATTIGRERRHNPFLQQQAE